MIKSAGFDEVSFERVDEKILFGTVARECIAFVLALVLAGEVFREVGDLAKHKRDVIKADMPAFLDGQERDEQGICVPTSSRVITARNPC
ncbi:MAG: hypothetical protein AAF922_08675 [Pseudomonadota bacterium]